MKIRIWIFAKDPKSLRSEDAGCNDYDQHGLDDLMRKTHLVDQQYQHRNIDEIAGRIGDHVAPESANAPSFVVKRPASVEQECLEHTDEVENRHCALVANAKIGYQEIQDIEDNV